MTEVAVDFGTSNTVLARYNQALERAETWEIPGISVPMGHEHTAWVIPSLIHYGEHETLIGKQVLDRGLAEHLQTFRWMKRAIAQRSSKKKKTAQGFKTAEEAGRDFLETVLRYASDRVSLTEDAFTFTAPVEAFEDFQDWLFRVAEGAGIERVRVRDEPTACVSGYHGVPRRDDRFVVFDFGGGTLDVACVRLELGTGANRKAVQLGQAGCDLGGMNIDVWLARDFAARHRLDEYEQREYDGLLLRKAEEVKIALSDPAQNDFDFQVAMRGESRTRLLRTTYTRSCGNCERGVAAKNGCLGCLLVENRFLEQVEETTRRALEQAAVKVRMTLDHVTRVLVTGGTSMVPLVRQFLRAKFGDRVVMDHPFDSVARGACSGGVEQILQHDYAIESLNKERTRYEFRPLFEAGTEYPLNGEKTVRKWLNVPSPGQTKIGLKIFEVSQVKRQRSLTDSIVGDDGGLNTEAYSRVETDRQYICLNPDEKATFVPIEPADPERDTKRYKAEFTVDGKRRLLVTVWDTRNGRALMENRVVVRL